MKDLEESTRARLVESAARIVGHTMEMKQESLSVLLLRDFAETPTTATTAPSLIQALHKESDPKRLRVRSVRVREFERDTRSWNITRNNINRAFSLFLGYAIDRHDARTQVPCVRERIHPIRSRISSARLASLGFTVHVAVVCQC